MRAWRQQANCLIARFGRSTDGSTAAEFAIAATVAVAIIFAVIDVGRAFIVNGLLSDSVRSISRENRVREVPYSGVEFSTHALATIAARASGFLTPADVTVVTTVYDNFQDLANGQTAGGAPPGGHPDQIVKYRLTYDMNYYTPFVGMLMDSVQFNHVAEIIVYNEPETES